MSYGAGWNPQYVTKVEKCAKEIVEMGRPVFVNPRGNSRPRWSLAMQACNFGLLEQNARGEFFAPAKAVA